MAKLQTPPVKELGKIIGFMVKRGNSAMTAEPLRIEITLANSGEWRVVERSHSAAENFSRVSFTQSELSDLLSEIKRCLLDTHIGIEAKQSQLCRLGSRLSELVLPPSLRIKVAAAKTSVEFFLDDSAVVLPLELLPHGNTVLAEALPVSRHWFCENALPRMEQSPRKQKQALIVADPAENLPGARIEGEGLCRRFRSISQGWNCRFLGRAVTVMELSRELPDTYLLHLAAHYVQKETSKESGIVLIDGIWTPETSTHTPELVFANCCRAGLPSNEKGELSLVGRFLRQGTKYVIAPFLPASDSVGESFASAFYQSFFSGKSVAIATWEARKAIGPASWIYWQFGGLPFFPVSSKNTKNWITAICLLLLAGAFLAAVNIYTKNMKKQDPQNLISETTLQNITVPDIKDASIVQAPRSKSDDILVIKDPYEELLKLLEQSNLKELQCSNETLHLIRRAAEAGDIQAIEIILKHGWPINARKEFIVDMPLLQYTVLRRHHDATEWLLKKGANPNAKGEHGTAMHIAAFYGDIPTMNLLYHYGGDINIIDNDSWTPAHRAAQGGKLESLVWLKNKGANVNSTDKYLVTPYWIAVKEEYEDITAWFVKNMKDGIGTPGSFSF